MEARGNGPERPGSRSGRGLSVLVLGDHLGYPHGIRHGVTTYYLNTLPVLADAGVRLRVCFLRPWRTGAEELAERGIRATFLDSGRWSHRAFWSVRSMLREQRTDIIHAIGMKSTLVARFAARQDLVLPVLHFHDQKPVPAWLRVANHRLAGWREAGIAVSAPVAECAVHDYGVSPARMRVIHSGVDPGPFLRPPAQSEALRRELTGGRSTARLVGVVGRMYPVKGHAAMIRMMAGVLDEKPETILVCVGDGPERPRCERLVRALGLQERVLFLGQRNDVPALLHCFDLLAVPSASEGLPFSAIEALAAGCPVIAFDVGGMGEIITHGITGWLVPASDHCAFQRGVVTLLRNRLPGERTGGTPEILERFTVKEHVRQLLACYRQALAEGNPAIEPLGGERVPCQGEGGHNVEAGTGGKREERVWGR